MLFKFALCFSFILLFHFDGYAEKKFSVTVQVPSEMNAKFFWISYDDGKGEIKVKDFSIKNNRIFISAPFYSIYAAVILSYPINGSTVQLHTDIFFVNDVPASITLCKSDSIFSPFYGCKLKNVFTFEKEQAALFKYDSVEVEELNSYVSTHESRISDSVVIRILNEKYKKIYEKDMDFIYKNHSSYYYFWFFRRNIISSEIISPDSLLYIFNTLFADSFKLSPEGHFIRKLLNGKIALQKSTSPNFVGKDISGTLISLSDFSNKKYVLMVFWATWCRPCVEEIPLIRTIWDNCLRDSLSIISVSLDTDYSRFMKVVTEEKMSWINIYHNLDVINAFGGNLPIPRIYLIDKSGKIIYKRDSNELTNLFKLLESNHLIAIQK
jgi:peroxiredoxin